MPHLNEQLATAGTNSFNDINGSALNDELTIDGPMVFQQPSVGSRGLGYDLGGFATVQSIGLSQFSDPNRRRIENLIVHTSGGDFAFTLPNIDDHTLTLSHPVRTQFVMLEIVSQHDDDDQQIGIDEIEVHASGTVQARTNLAAGAAGSIQGDGWNNVLGDLTDGVLFGANGDVSTGIFNTDPAAAGTAIVIDLGSVQGIGALGIAQHDFSALGGRRLIQEMTIEFSSAADFSSVASSQSLTLERLTYQVVPLDPTLARYVRLTFQNQYGGADGNVGFTEIQLFAALPEPGTLVMCLAILAALRRR
jgi:hypothetical protein